MNLLFIQGGSRLKRDTDGNWYTDGNFTKETWEEYLSYCDELTVLLRREDKEYEPAYAEKKFIKMPISDKLRVVPLIDIMRPKRRSLNYFIMKNLKKTIDDEIKKTDKVIIRSYSVYTDIAYKSCLKHNKPYLAEVTGFMKEGMGMHSILGRLVADRYENNMKKLVSYAECASYVTQFALQNRYPCGGEMLGCSDVQLPDFDYNEIITKRNEHKVGDRLVLGTTAFLDVRWKGQDIVLKAIALLKKKGIKNIEYQLVGLGKGTYLKDVVSQLGIMDQVKFIGGLPHEEVFKWLDSIDIYIQPSYQEGLCRAIVEAMSRACPVVCSDVGGNSELIDMEYIFAPGDYMGLADKIEAILPNLKTQSERNIKKSLEYNRDILRKRKYDFCMKFINKK